LDPDQARRFLQEQTETLRRSPLVPHQETWALVTEAGPGKTGLKVAVGPYEGAIAGTNLHPGLKKAGTSGLFQPGDKIWVKALGQNPATGQWTLALGQHRNAQAALVCLDPGTGEIKAMVGGREEGSGGFNRAVQSRRQPGSAFKPIIYTAAMENGFSPESILIDAPVVHNLFGQGLRWKPMNYDGQFHGPTDLYTGLVESRNIIAIKLLEEVGVDRTIECARRLGITSDLASNPTLALGSSGVSLLEMVQAYAVFPGQGKRPEPLFVTRVEDREGRLIDAFGPSRTQAVEPATAAVMTWMLKGVVENGTGGRIRALGRPCGGKTGTTNDRADAWFVGFTPEYVTGVWVGRDDLTPLGPGESGARAAAPIFLEYMRAALAGRPVRDFSLPSDVRLVDLGNRRVLVRDNQAAALAFRPSPAVDELEKEM
jgi:penicillin-binding protein 1A